MRILKNLIKTDKKPESKTKEIVYCKDCRFAALFIPTSTPHNNGVCKLYPPVQTEPNRLATFPIVDSFTFCFQGEKREEETSNVR